MKIISWNVNGLRAVAKREFLDWLKLESPDILCLQEIKLGRADLTTELENIDGYYSYFNFAQKRGYSGVAVYTKTKPRRTTRDVFNNEQCNVEGRTLLVEYDNFAVLNVYMPHGARDKSKLTYKLNVYSELQKFLSQYKQKPLIITGDFNIAHEDGDLARPKQNRKNVMFTPEERAQIDALLSLGYSDTYRMLNPESVGYTWWPYLAGARERNIGWRIDYIFAPQSLNNEVTRAGILSAVLGSDHCPVIAELSIC